MSDQSTPTVASVKRAVRRRDHNRCVDCGMDNRQHKDRYGRGLAVHRLIPGSEYTLAGCVLLCRVCHNGKPVSPPKLRYRTILATPGDGPFGSDYRDVPGAPGYRVGKDGSLWSCLKSVGSCWHGDRKIVLSGRWRKLAISRREGDGKGRYTYRLADGSYRRAYAGVIVLEAFVGPRPEGLECCHNNGDPLDDRLDNLRWDTHSANLLDRRAHGTAPRGEVIHTAKLTADDVREIRRLGYPLRQHVSRFGITVTMASLIIRRKAWQHVE